MSKIIGIDLGTTNSVVAIMEGSDERRRGELIAGQLERWKLITNA